MTSLLRAHDAVLIDLDGTLLLAGHVIRHAAEVMDAIRSDGIPALVVTNNASRTPEEVARRLTERGIPTRPGEVVNSAQAAAALLARDHPPGTAILVLGTDALAQAVTDAGLRPVRSADDRPAAVVQGHSPDTGWRDLAEACVAIRSGAAWTATNTDTTLPTDRGLLPGNGSLVQALAAATGQTPRVAGKPARPLIDAAADRVGARHPLVVGDRLDTDIAAAVAAGLPSLMVLTGVSGVEDLLAAPVDARPTYVSADLRGLIDPARFLRVDRHAFADSDGLRAALVEHELI